MQSSCKSLWLIPEKPKKVLDIATGTGDLAIEVMKTNANEIIGVDISEGMLEIGVKKVKNHDRANSQPHVFCVLTHILSSSNLFEGFYPQPPWSWTARCKY